MRSSIFDIENRLDIRKEFDRLSSSLFHTEVLFYDSDYLSIFDFLDKYVFCLWKYRDTFTNIFEYLEHIGVEMNYDNIITEEAFLNFLEFLLNIWKTANDNINFNKITVLLPIYFEAISHNVPILLEKLNYKPIIEKDKVIIVKRDSDVDSILDVVTNDISNLLLSYNDIRNNNIDSKKKILKDLDLYIEKEKSKYKSYDNSLYDSIQTIVNELGINHPLKRKEIKKDELCKWYDKCFKMMIHLIRYEEIIKIKNDRKKLVELSDSEVKAC